VETFLLLIVLVGVVILWAYDKYKLRQYTDEYNHFSEVFELVMDGQEDVVRVVNVNASSLRSLQATVDRQDKNVAILSTLVELHAETLKVGADLRSKLESTAILDLPVEELVDEDVNED